MTKSVLINEEYKGLVSNIDILFIQSDEAIYNARNQRHQQKKNHDDLSPAGNILIKKQKNRLRGREVSID